MNEEFQKNEWAIVGKFFGAKGPFKRRMANSFAYILWACFSPFLIFSPSTFEALENVESVLHKLFKNMIPSFKFQVKVGPGQVGGG